MKALTILVEAIVAMIFVAGISVGAQNFLTELKKETFTTMRKFMSISLEGYTQKMTGNKSEFAVADEVYKKQQIERLKNKN